MSTEVDWYGIGQAERQLLNAVVDFENEMIRIERTTYSAENADAIRAQAVAVLRHQIQSYSRMVLAEQAKLPCGIGYTREHHQ